MPSTLILSFCYADIPYVLSTWQQLSRDISDVQIICVNQGLLDRILQISQAESLDINSNSAFVSHDPASIVDLCSQLYLFTMGSLDIANVVLYCLHNGITVFYQDCYFDLDNYSTRLINPFWHLLSKYRASFCSPMTVVKQIFRQIWYDPLKRSVIFSGDSHCWIIPSIVARLPFPNVTPMRFTSKLSMPPNSLLFTLNSTENQLSIDWEFFKSSGYALYYKPHPLTASDYNRYPDFVKPFAERVDPAQIFFPENSFLLSFYSTSLASTSQSISLSNMYYKTIHPLLRLYSSFAVYSPSTYEQLASMLSTQF